VTIQLLTGDARDVMATYWTRFGEGFYAYKTGDVCPYDYTSVEARCWREGHREAEQRAKDKR
jgi:hypothetical protein